MNVSIRASFGQWVSAIVVACVLTGCAATGVQTGMSRVTLDDGKGGAGAGEDQTPKIDLAKLVETCAGSPVQGLSDLEDVGGILRRCIGAPSTKEGKIAAAHAALLLLANYGERSIRVFKTEDLEHAGADATLLKGRVEKVRERLSAIKNAAPGADLVFWSEYSAAMNPDGVDAMLYGVSRAALAPLVRRTKDAVRQYISSAAGGAGGALREVLKRREIIVKKVGFVDTTIRLGSVALVEARCGVEYIEPPKAGKAVSDDLGQPGACHDFKRLGAAGSAEAVKRHWEETDRMLTETIKRLDKIIDEAAETV